MTEHEYQQALLLLDCSPLDYPKHKQTLSAMVAHAGDMVNQWNDTLHELRWMQEVALQVEDGLTQTDIDAMDASHKSGDWITLSTGVEYEGDKGRFFSGKVA